MFVISLKIIFSALKLSRGHQGGHDQRCLVNYLELDHVTIKTDDTRTINDNLIVRLVGR